MTPEVAVAMKAESRFQVSSKSPFCRVAWRAREGGEDDGEAEDEKGLTVDELELSRWRVADRSQKERLFTKVPKANTNEMEQIHPAALRRTLLLFRGLLTGGKGSGAGGRAVWPAGCRLS